MGCEEYKEFQGSPVKLTGSESIDSSTLRVESLLESSTAIFREDGEISTIPVDTLSLPVQSPVKTSYLLVDSCDTISVDTLSFPVPSPLSLLGGVSG